jgi:hypothetical protein
MHLASRLHYTVHLHNAFAYVPLKIKWQKKRKSEKAPCGEAALYASKMSNAQ